MAETWFTSDTHFGHIGVLGYMRPEFSSIDEHDQTLIEMWNAHIHPKDFVYHLGDFALCRRDRWWDIRGELNGRIYLVQGNHDEGLNQAMLATFEENHMLLHRRFPDLATPRTVMCHYPLRTWRSCWVGSVHLHGHSHNHEPRREEIHEHRDGSEAPQLWERRIDVGVDAWGYKPVHIEELKALIEKE